MSYDISIQDEADPCPTCGHHREVDGEWFNITWNIRPMLDHVGMPFQSLALLKGRALKQAIAQLRADLHNPSNQRALLALNPKNGWGSLEGLKTFVIRLGETAETMKNPRMEVS